MKIARVMFVLALPVVAILGLFAAAISLRPDEEPPIPRRRVVEVVDGEEVVKFVTAAPPRTPAKKRAWAFGTTEPARGARVPVAVDIETAAENSRIQSTYQNYRTAVLTQNEELRKTLLEVLRRDGEVARGYAQEAADLAETDSERALALKALADLSR